MNCTTAQGKPCATQRTIMPKADEDLPLPAPVWTMMSPLSPLFSAIMRSRTAFFLAILALCLASSACSCSVLISEVLRACSFGLTTIPLGQMVGQALVPVLRQAKRECDRLELHKI